MSQERVLTPVLHNSTALGKGNRKCVCACVKDTGVPVPGMDMRLCGGQSSAVLRPLTQHFSLWLQFSGLNFRASLRISCNSQLPKCIQRIFHLTIFLTYDRLI